ncbi:MAG: HEAT repeat domain-containing protein [Planctomycetes bacterium]|nr:HEAT repeat domain-containing protein [Planctomycetota bacterium]
MIATQLLALVLFSTAPLEPSASLANAGVPASAQDKPAENTNPDNRPEIKAMIEELTGRIDKRGKEDHEAVGVIDRLLQEFPKCGPKDRVAVVAALDKCLGVKRQENSDGVRDNKLFLASAVALRAMAPESAKVLMNWIGAKDHKKDLPLQEKLIQSLGKTKDENGRKFLIKLLNDKTPRILAAAAEALGEFGDAELKLRKETFEELLKLLMETKAANDAGQASNQSDPIAAEKYNTIAAPIISALQKLSKHDEHDPNEWQRWWNKNKKEDWDEKDA